MNTWSNGPDIQSPRHCRNPSQVSQAQWRFFKNIKNATNSEPHAYIPKIEIYSELPQKRTNTMGRPQGMPKNRKPHGRHAPGIHIYVLTLPTFSTSHTSFPSRSTL